MDPSPRSISQPELLENLVWVQALARRLVSEPSAVEDIVQDTWVIALERPPRRTTGPALRAWLARVVRTMARRYRRPEGLLDRRSGSASGEEAEPSTLDVVTRVARQRRIIEAVMGLDEPDRTTILLRYVDGLTACAIAERRGETSAAVRQRLSRALAKLRGRLEREFDDEEGGWVRALAPLALAGGRDAATAGWAGTLGGAIVTKTAVSIGIGTAAVLGAVWLLWDGGPAAPAQPEVASPAAGAPLVAAGEVDSADEAFSTPESAAPARAAVAAPEVPRGAVYALLDPEGRAVPGAKLFLCRNGEVVAHGVTDASGELATDLRGGESARLLVQAPGVAPLLRDVTLAPERHVIQLEEGAVVSGWIVVDGEPPSERIPLRLRAGHDLLPLEDLLGLTLEDAGIDRQAGMVSHARAGGDGSFRFYGLPVDWSGTLDLPDDYHVADPLLANPHLRHVFPVPAPVQGLRVEVVKRLALTGRVIASTQGAPIPVPGAWIDPALDYPGADRDPGRKYQGMVKTDDEGRFRIAALDAALDGGSLVISPPDRQFYRVVPVEPRELHGDADLGDLALRDLRDRREVALLVQDAGGVPIEGAVAATDEASPLSPPSGADGRTSLAVPVARPSTLAVVARGYRTVEVPVPAPLPEELVVTLARGALLEIQFRRPDGEVAPRVAVTLLASGPPYRAAGSAGSYRACRETGCSFPWTGRSGGEDLVTRWNADRAGRVVWNDLAPGLPLHLRVHGPHGTFLQEVEVAPLGPEERRSLEVVLAKAPRTLRGRVLDETGTPLTEAHCGLSWEEPDQPRRGTSSSSEVDEDAGFEFTDVYSGTVFLRADADGHVSFQDPAFPVPADGSPVEIRLAPAHVVTVLIEDEDGRGVPGKVYADLPSGGTLGGSEVQGQAGTYLLKLPAGEVTVRARVHGVFHVRRHDALVPELRIEVPRLGQVEVTLRHLRDLGLDEWCHAWLLPRGGPDLVPRYALTDLRGDGPATVPDVLPGAYELTVRRFLQGDYPPDAWFEEIEGSFFEELVPRVPLVVRPGQTTTVEVDL